MPFQNNFEHLIQVYEAGKSDLGAFVTGLYTMAYNLGGEELFATISPVYVLLAEIEGISAENGFVLSEANRIQVKECIADLRAILASEVGIEGAGSSASFDLEIVVSYEIQLRIGEAVLKDAASSSVTFEKRSKGFSALRTKKSDWKEANFAKAAYGYLQEIKQLGLARFVRGGQLRVGCFYDSDTFASYSLSIPQSVSDVLSELKLELQLEIYPCSSQAM